HDFAFGKGRTGNTALLEQLSRQLGFGLTVVAPVASDDAVSPGASATNEAFASRRIRALIEAGEMRAAAKQLGRSWEITGIVQHGDARGRALGYPTANLSLGNILRPRFGIYAVRVQIAGEKRWRAAIANLGVRPMWHLTTPLLEVHLFDFDDDLYG